MTDDLYERYKEALRIGHVAVLRGSLEEALEAYRTAASIAPSRALPHTSIGGVLLRLGHLEEALVAYAAAVARAPHDEGALLGQAEALTMAGQRVDAAGALDHVAEIQEAADRLPEAADTLRRALELEDAPERARHQRGLLREIRLSAGDQAAEQLLARALRLRDEPSAGSIDLARAGLAAPTPRRSDAAATAPSTSASQPTAERNPEPGPLDAPIEPAAVEAELMTPERVEAGLTGDSVAAAESVTSRSQPVAEAAPATPAPEPAVEKAAVKKLITIAASAEAEPAGSPEPVVVARAPELPEPAAVIAASEASAPIPAEPDLAAVGVMADPYVAAALQGLVGESQHQPTGDELLAAAEAADLAGDNTALRSLLVWTARAYAREGRFEAGLDAAHRLLQRTPGDVDAHLVLVELYVARDWNSLASEKLTLLARLAELDGDQDTRRRLCAVAARAYPADERLGALCA